MKTTVARVLLAAGVLFAVALATAGPAAADCANSPTISINPSSGRGGDTFNIAGSGFCPTSNRIQLRFLQGGNVFDLGSVSGSEASTFDGTFTGVVYVPTNTTAGSATVQAFGSNGAPAVPFTVTASTVASGGTTSPTTPRATATTAAPATATTVAPAVTTTVVPAPPAATTATTASTTVTTTATTETTAVPASNNSGLNGGGLAVTIVLLALVVLGTILASLATAGRLPLPKGRPRPRVERAAAAEAAAAAAAAGAAAGTAAAVDDEPDRFESSTAPIEPIPDPFAPADEEPEATAPIESPVFDDEPSAAADDEEPSAAMDDDEPSAGIEEDDAEADEPSAGIDDESPASEEIAFPDDEPDGKTN